MKHPEEWQERELRIVGRVILWFGVGLVVLVSYLFSRIA